ncbi:MAG: glycosyltransferase [Candidatus Omnitrophica bacterium]|nr:glycosyltransferase [Candidatus Omnitrophota bacterium]
MEKELPLVSICVPTKDRPEYLRQSIKSILAQDLLNMEIIISDNASTIQTFNVVNEIHDKRIKYSRNNKDLGLVGNLNRCIAMARGKYICIFHDDDIMLNENISKKVEMLESNPNVALVHSDIKRIDENSNIIGKHWASDQAISKITYAKDMFELLLTDKNPICAPSVMVRRKVYDEVGLFDEKLDYTCDWNMWMRIAALHDIGYIDQPLILYRCHKDMGTQKYLRTKGVSQIYQAKIRAIEKLGKDNDNYCAYIRQVKKYTKQRALKLAKRYFKRKEFKEAIRSFFLGIII